MALWPRFYCETLDPGIHVRYGTYHLLNYTVASWHSRYSDIPEKSVASFSKTIHSEMF